ncbi:MAG: sugar transferase [Faecalimonas sp.]|nr:sugar transferase [Faecalimonas sp.]
MLAKGYEVTKRIFDILAAFLAIVCTSPIWVVAAIGIYVSDPGPIFYVARRVGKDNRLFPMYKFRSMYLGDANESVFRGEEDRIFAFGRFIRATKIDELPQLICCLQGTMSVIGPRPAAEAQMEITRGGEYAVVSNVRPGLSGPAAVYDYIYGDTIEDEEEYKEKVLPTRLGLELYYVKHRSWGYDIKIIWYTVVCILASVFRKEPKRILDELIASSESLS